MIFTVFVRFEFFKGVGLKRCVSAFNISFLFFRIGDLKTLVHTLINHIYIIGIDYRQMYNTTTSISLNEWLTPL